MPQVYREVDLEKVQAIIIRRGYHFHNNRNAALQLTKPDPNPRNTFKFNNQRKRVVMAPISRSHLKAIVQLSSDENEAAEQIIALSEGAILSPTVGGQQKSGPAMDPSVVEKLVTARAQNEVASQTRELTQIIAAQQAQLDEMKAMLLKQQASQQKADEIPGAKKRGWPKGKPRT